MGLYGMGITVDVPEGTRRQLFAKVDEIKKTAGRATIAIGALAGAILLIPVGMIIVNRSRK